jgi:hypothetical protein
MYSLGFVASVQLSFFGRRLIWSWFKDDAADNGKYVKGVKQQAS